MRHYFVFLQRIHQMTQNPEDAFAKREPQWPVVDHYICRYTQTKNRSIWLVHVPALIETNNHTASTLDPLPLILPAAPDHAS